MESQQTSRRAVLAGMCAIATIGFTNLIPLSPAEAASAVSMGKDGKARVTLSYLKKVGSVVAIPQLNAAFVKVSATKYAAFNLRCTHMGITVDASGPVWVCPGHQSRFDPKTGKVLSGPAPFPLAKLPVKLSKGVAIIG